MVSEGNGEKQLNVVVDGEPESLPYSEGETLMQVLRRAGHYSIKNACSEGVCGACNVLFGENQIVRSCLVKAEQYEGAEITTAAGLVADDGTLHPLQQAFLDHGAAQCGFCIPGMIISGVGLLERSPDPSEKEIRQALRGNICRCTGYVQQFEAIKDAAKRMQNEGAATEAD